MFKNVAILCLLILTASGCDTGPSSPRGFSLPEGNSKNGELVFKHYRCQSCHSLSDYEGDPSQHELQELIQIGGKVTQIVTYAELVTSIINPSHKFSKSYSSELFHTDGVSKMRNYNDIMTVSQLIDLVTFLQPHYTLEAYDGTYYMEYH